MTFTFGSDPEFILKDTYGNLRSAIDVIKTSKKYKTIIGNDCFYYDNVLAECTVTPAHHKDEAVENMRKVLASYKSIVDPVEIHIQSSATYPKSELEHPHARIAGCKVESCAYEMKDIEPKGIKHAFKHTDFRTAGGHVHLGTTYGRKHHDACMLVRMLDLFVGIPSLYIDSNQASFARRKLYGQPGRYRTPNHGVEYRTLSSFWIASPKRVEMMFSLCEFVLNFTSEGGYKQFWEVDHETLNHKDFWNTIGDPTKCHKCHGYDVEKMKSLFYSDEETLRAKGSEFMKIVEDLMPKHLFSQITEQINTKPGKLYQEWDL